MSTSKFRGQELTTSGETRETPWGDLAVFFLWPLGLYLLWRQPRAFASHLRGLAAFAEKRTEPVLTAGDHGKSPWFGLAAFLFWPLGGYLLWRQPRAFASHLRGLAAFAEGENKLGMLKGDLRAFAAGGGDDGEGMKPLYVGLAIVFVFPVGLYLLWKHPVLGRNKAWWWTGGGWSFLVLLAVLNGDKDKGRSRSEAGTVDAGAGANQTSGRVNISVTKDGAGGPSVGRHHGGWLTSSWDYKNGCQVIYDGTVTGAEARRLGDFLERQGLFEGDTKTFKIVKAGKTYAFKVVIKKGLEQDPEAIEGMKQMGSELSRYVFGDAEVDVHLCDERFRTIRVVVP